MKTTPKHAPSLAPYTVDRQVASTYSPLPSLLQLERWVSAALQAHIPHAELTIRFVDEAESAALNQQYRQKQGATNVLSFTFAADIPNAPPLLGDLVLCAPLIAQEAMQQHKTLDAHYAHLVIHGSLHLLGYDHEVASAAQIMEDLEIHLLAALGYSNPYTERTPHE